MIDDEGRIADMHFNTWLSYQQDSVEINVKMERKQKLSWLLIDCLQDHKAWIFLPQQIQLFYFDEGK